MPQIERKSYIWLYPISAVVLLLCVFFGPSGTGIPDLDTSLGRSIMYLRINRVLQGFIVGAALSCAGAVFQAVLRNPLAEPYILGVSGGAGLGAAICILSGFTAVSIFALPLSAFISAALTLALVFVLAKRGSGTPSIYSLILSGVILSAICSSILMFLVSTASAEGLHSVIWWMLGNLQPASSELLWAVSMFILAGWAGAIILARELNALTLGLEVAHHIGIQPKTVVVVSLGIATIMTASAVSISGLIGFVGLIVPHVMRAVVGPDHRRLLPAAGVAGGAFLAAADAIARSAMNYEIPVGVVTALFGGPFFLMILARRRKQGWIE